MTKLNIPALTEEAGYTHPMLGGGLGSYSYAVLGELGGLTQFGAHVEVLPPGSRSSFRHWHQDEDEFVMILSGEVMLIKDEEAALVAVDVACWPKGAGPAHCLENYSTAEASYLVIGTHGGPQDEIHYPDHDLFAFKDGTARRYTHLDGRPRKNGGDDAR